MKGAVPDRMRELGSRRRNRGGGPSRRFPCGKDVGGAKNAVQRPDAGSSGPDVPGFVDGRRRGNRDAARSPAKKSGSSQRRATEQEVPPFVADSMTPAPR